MEISNYFKWENKYMRWISTHRFLWVCLLFLVGFLLGFSGNLIVGGDFRQGTIMSFTYGLLLMVVDLSAWGVD
ncbi:hypothetical protein LCGC14_0461890 [marine sediment metagenome]|uniref:Uncharacterized protein n=1 Tax=marine sediment metagenome TaxID=412755 RepID=A0A0F9SEP7_9ZZZZ